MVVSILVKAPDLSQIKDKSLNGSGTGDFS